MREEFVNPFLSPAIGVWEKELGESLKFSGARAVSHQFTTNDITAVIGVTGQLKGNVLYEFSGDTAKGVASAMIGEPLEQMNDIALSAIGELANMITGNAATLLAGAGFVCDISPPVMLEPKGARITLPSGSQIEVQFTSTHGPFNIRIGLAETDVGSLPGRRQADRRPPPSPGRPML